MTDTAFQRSFGIVKAIDAEFNARRRVVQEAYDKEMAPVRAEFKRRQMDADCRLKATLKELDKHRNDMLRLAGALPVKLAEIQSVKRVTVEGASVSVARLGCLEKR